MASLITLSNQALAAIGKGQIASLEETSLEARECNRFASGLLGEMAEWSDSLPLNRTRTVLALTTNDRPAEWLYCYAAPSDMQTPVAVRKAEDSADWLPESSYEAMPWQDALPLAFIHEDGKIFTNIEDATLIYVRSGLTAGQLSPLMQRAFVLELAARLAGPLTKDMKVVQGLSQQAEFARARAVAHEENKAVRVNARYVSDAERARWGQV